MPDKVKDAAEKVSAGAEKVTATADNGSDEADGVRVGTGVILGGLEKTARGVRTAFSAGSIPRSGRGEHPVGEGVRLDRFLVLPCAAQFDFTGPDTTQRTHPSAMNTVPQSAPAATAPRTRLIVVDDQGSIRGFLRETLGRHADYEIVAEGRTGTEALRLCREFEPRVIIMELMLPEMGAATLIGELRASGSATRTLIFTGCRHEAALLDALRARPHGFVHKDESLPALWEALRTVSRGGCSISASIGRLHDRLANEAPGATLTIRERAVLQMIAEGKPSKVIADSLGVSGRAIEHNRASLMEKLDAHDIARLTRIAVQMGLV